MESLILIILVIIPGVWSGSWGVTPEDQCALKGTSVVIKCKYDYPFGHIVTSASWFKSLYASGEWQKFPLSQLPSPSHHFKYVGDYWSDCSLLVHDVQLTDEGEYFFHFGTTLNRWKSTIPAHLSVRELTAVVEPSTVTEGNDVNLTCVSGCPTPTDTVWFRDGQRVPEPVFQASREDAGRYYCAVLAQETVRSASMALNVQYAPIRVTLSVSPSAIKGSSVTFTCSSDANPPVTHSGYSLYKDGRFITSGQNYTISGVQLSHNGLYYCQAWNNISRWGVDLINSTEVHLDVQYRPENISISVDPPHVVEGSRVNLTCSSAANPAADNYTWYRVSSGSMLQVGSGQVLSLPSVEASHTGLYICQATNQLGGNNSTEVLLAMKEKNHGIQSFLILAGIGVSVVFVTLLLLFWLKRRTRTAKKDVTPHSQRKSQPDDPTSNEDEVPYSTVTIKPRDSSPPPLTHNSWSGDGGKDNSVIYTKLAESS